MENKSNPLHANEGNLKFGFYISAITSLLTVITFAVAICTPPLSGPFCTGNCFEYPFTDIAERFPRDYYWMYLTIILSFMYLMMMITVYQTAQENKKLFGLIGFSFALMASLVLIANYFIQVSVIQPSLLAGETDGISILSQFNPHGVFIVMEEIGFVLMIFSFFAVFPLFSGSNKLEKTIKSTAIIGFLLTVISFALISIKHGINREYRFEVIVISITWLELILMSFLFSRYFKKLFHPKKAK